MASTAGASSIEPSLAEALPVVPSERTPLLGGEPTVYSSSDPTVVQVDQAKTNSGGDKVSPSEIKPQEPMRSPIDELVTRLKPVVGPYVGETWFSVALISATVFITYLLSYFGLGLVLCLFLAYFIAKLYGASLEAAYARKVQKLQDFLMIPELETDIESVGWINRFLDRFWAQFEPHLAHQIASEVEKAAAAQLPPFITSAKFAHFTLGTKPPLVEGVKYYPREESDVIIMDWKVSFCPHAHHPAIGLARPPTHPNFDSRVFVDVAFKLGPLDFTLPVKVSDIRFLANLRIKLRLMNAFPHIKAIEVSLLSPPEIDVCVCPVWFDVTNLPGFWALVNRQIRLNLAGIALAPKAFSLDVEGLLSGSDAESAIGVLKLTVVSARNLKNVELIGMIDPFVSIDIEGRKELVRSRAIDNTTEPDWDETFTILLHNLTETMNLVVKDQNGVKKDYALGACAFSLSTLLSEPQQELCLPLLRQGKARGDLTFHVSYFPVADPIKREDGSEEVVPSNSGVLKLFVRQVSGLERQKKMLPFGSDHSVQVEVKLNGQPLVATTPKEHSSNVVIESATEHFVDSLAEANLTLSLISSGTVAATFPIKLSALLERLANQAYWFDFATGANPSTQGARVKLDAKWAPVLMDPEAHGSLPLPIGFVRVQVRQGKDLKTAELGGSVAPSVVVLMSNKVYGRTTPLEATHDPVWDALVYVPIHRAKEVLRFEVKGPAALKKEASLGQIDLPVADLLGPPLPDREGYADGELCEGWHPLKSRGQVELAAQFFSIVPEALPARAAETPPSEGSSPIVDSAEASAEPETPRDLTQYNAGVLRVTVVEARGVGGPNAQLYVGVYLNGDAYNPVLRTRVCKNSSTPAWGEAGESVVKEVDVDKLTVAVKDARNNDKVVGKWETKLDALIAGLHASQPDEPTWYQLDSGIGAIQLKFHFRPTQYQIHPSESARNRGILQVKVLFAENLIPADKDGSSDPYVALSLNGGKKSKTEVRKNTLNPEFGQTFSFKVMDRINSTLRIEAFDWNQIQSHKALGYAEVALEPLPVETQVVEAFPLAGVSSGAVTLELVFAPMYVFTGVSSGLLDAALSGNPVDLVGGLAKGGFGLAKGTGKFAVGGATMLATGGANLAGGAITSTGKLALGGAKLAGEGAKTVLGAPIKLASGGAGLAKGLFGKKNPSQNAIPAEMRKSSSQPEGGVLRVTLVEAKDLKAVDRNGYSDPYIKVLRDNKLVYKTKVIKKSRNPVWDESFTLPPMRGEPLELRLHVKDYNTFGENLDLGDYVLNPWDHVTDLGAAATVDVWTKVGDLQNGGSGLLHLTLDYTPASPAGDAPEPASDAVHRADTRESEADPADDRRAPSGKSSFLGSLRKKISRT
ncbi:Tricalbin-2 [Massospora cicadina]|nr:Tricalbin-2 [Massospora cicadina]